MTSAQERQDFAKIKSRICNVTSHQTVSKGKIEKENKFNKEQSTIRDD